MSQKKQMGESGGPQARERLLSAALDLFTEKGYAATSVREIVSAAGVTKPVLYYYFKNKEGLYLELMSKPFEVLEGHLEEIGAQTLSSRERVSRLFDRIFLLFVQNLKAARLMYAIYYGPPQGAPFFDFEEYHLKIRGVVEAIVKHGIKSGEFRVADGEALVWLLIGALNFILEEQLCRREPLIDKNGLSRTLSLIFDGVAENKKGKKHKLK